MKRGVLVEDDFNLVWTIHKEADTLLHTRIQSFLTLQAILIGSHFTSIALVKSETAKFFYAITIVSIGFVIARRFQSGNSKIIDGIIRLKTNYLCKEPFYEEFYGKELPQYKLARSVPNALMGLWLILGIAMMTSQFYVVLYWSSFFQKLKACALAS